MCGAFYKNVSIVPVIAHYYEKNEFKKINFKQSVVHILSILHTLVEQYIGNKIQAAAERQS